MIVTTIRDNDDLIKQIKILRGSFQKVLPRSPRKIYFPVNRKIKKAIFAEKCGIEAEVSQKSLA